MSYEDQPLDDYPVPFDPVLSGPLQKVRIPAALLICVGILNILGAFFYAFTGLNALLNPQSLEQGAKQFNLPQTNAQSAATAAVFYLVLFTMAVVAGAITILGGIRMLKLKSFVLAIFGSILAAIPCLSTTSCCGIGEAVGIWALIVLMSAEVSSAFR
jgi:MFS family permease